MNRYIYVMLLLIVFSSACLFNDEKSQGTRNIRLYETKLAVNPNDVIVLRNIAVEYLNIKNTKKALFYIEKAYQQDKNDLATLNTLAHVYIGCSDTARAISTISTMEELLKKSNKTTSGKAMFYYHAATLYFKIELYDKALEMIDLALKLQPDDKIWIDEKNFNKSNAAHDLYLNFKKEIQKVKDPGFKQNNC